MTIDKLRISFTGMASNALRSIQRLEYLAKHSKDFKDLDDDENLAYDAQSCISAYRDTILALARGETTVEEVKDFWFHNLDPATIPYESSVIKFTEAV